MKMNIKNMNFRAFTTIITVSLLSACLALGTGCVSDDDGTGDPGPDTLAPDGGQGGDLVAGDQAVPDSASSLDELGQLASWMTGQFSSEEQSQQDPTYYHITLVMKRIWPERDQGLYWLYVEQAMAGDLPYRQRVYRLERLESGKLLSRVYNFKSKQVEQAAVGVWKAPDPLSGLDEHNLVRKEGCGVHLSWDAALQQFKGATERKKCPSDLNGATYASSDVTVTESRVTSWDRGFNDSDLQVWGATAGPYTFDKIAELDPELDK
jgi:hypothetical protein